MKNILILSLALLISMVSANVADAQSDSLMKSCAQNLPSSYISDGQVYQTPIASDETAEFNVTFYGGSTYRVAACLGKDAGNLVFTIYDRDRNELYCSAEHNNAPFWDFKFADTVDCLIEARMANQNEESGFAILLIGFKN
ncbi:MAG: hypothetical protein MJZ66_06765 [Bacteroidales bacterium]|nr:hypothetical protein [Bacteroidales bacterium]